MTFAATSRATRAAVSSKAASATRHIGRTALFGAAAVLTACVALIAGNGFDAAEPDTARLGTRLDQVEARIQSLEFETDRDGSAAQFRAARALVFDLGKELEALRSDAATRQARLEARIDRLEKQTSANIPTASIQGPSLATPAATLIPLPAPALSADLSPADRDSLVAATTDPAPTSADYQVTEIYRGQAIVEGRTGVRRVAVGDDLPGLGRIEAIEPRGKGWAVVTTGGIVTSRED